MENIGKTSISRLYKELKSRVEVRALIPMGYGPGMPVITVKNDQLVAMVPFLRYKVTGEVDRTLVFPIRYILEFLVPEGQLVGFKDLSVEPGYAEFDFDKVIGFFRHEAIKQMDRKEYFRFKEETLGCYDHLVNYAVGEDEEYSEADDRELRNKLQTIVEPFVAKEYVSLDEEFYNKYLKK